LCDNTLTQIMLHRNISLVAIKSCSWPKCYVAPAPFWFTQHGALGFCNARRPSVTKRIRTRRCPNRSFAGPDRWWTYNPPCRGSWPPAFTCCCSHWGRGCFPIRTLIRTLRWDAGFSNTMRSRPLIRFPQTFAERTGLRSSASRKLHLRQPTRREAGSRRRTDGSRSCGGSRSVDSISAARVATNCGACRRALRTLADGAPHPGASSHSRASSDGSLDRDTDPCRRYTQCSALAPPAIDDAVGQPARQFHVRPGNDRTDSVRCALARATFGAVGCCPTVADVRAPCLGCGLPKSIRPEMILVTFRTVALGAALTTVAEWRSQDFTHLGGFEVIMLGAFGFALYRGVTLPWVRIVMLFGVLHLALSPGASRRSPRTARTDISRPTSGRTIQDSRRRQTGFTDT
jgi:hypothetical protein